MEQRPVGADDERRRLGEREVAHVPLVELELDARLSRALARHRGSIAGDESTPITFRPISSRSGSRPSGADGELDDRPVRLGRQPDVEGDVLRHVGGHAS